MRKNKHWVDFYHYRMDVYTHCKHTFHFKLHVKVNLASDDLFEFKLHQVLFEGKTMHRFFARLFK